MSKLVTKNALFEHFWASILKKILSNFKSAPTNLSNCKIWQREPKMSKFGTKNTLFHI